MKNYTIPGDEEHHVSEEKAIDMLADNDGRVHTFRNSSFAMLGADWDTSDVVAAIREAGGAAETGESARAMHHGLAIADDVGLLFLETKESKVTDATD